MQGHFLRFGCLGASGGLFPFVRITSLDRVFFVFDVGPVPC